MAQRTFQLIGAISGFGPVPVAGAPCSFSPLVPGGTAAVDGVGAIVSTEPIPFTTDDGGNFVALDGFSPVLVDYPGDFEAAYANTQVRVVANGLVIDSPVGFAYAATVDVATWIGAAVATGKVRMRLVYTQDDGTPIAGAALDVAITQPAAVVASGVVLSSGTPVRAISDSTGTFRIDLDPNALLNPTGLAYTATITNPDGGVEPNAWIFTVQTVVDVYQGAYNAGTTYHAASGSSNGDVVLSGGVLYRCILTHTNHVPPNATYWHTFAADELPTDLITDHLTTTVPVGLVAITAGGIAHSAGVEVLADDSVQSPTSVDDDLTILDDRTSFARRTITTTATLDHATDDWIDADATAATFTITLPDAASRRRPYYVKRTSAGVHNVVIGTTGGQTIDGAASHVLTSQYDAIILHSTGAGWGLASTVGSSTFADATTTTVGGAEIDQAPASGHPVAVTVPSKGAAGGVAPLGQDLLVQSAYLPTLGSGSVAEAARWARSGGNPILSGTLSGEENSWQEPTVLLDGGIWKMWATRGWTNPGIGYATCPGTSDPTQPGNWTKYGSNPVLGQGGSGIAGYAAQAGVIKLDGTYYCYYANSSNIRLATSSDGIAWTAVGIVVANGITANANQWANMAVWRESTTSWKMLLEGHTPGGIWNIFLLTSADGAAWSLQNGGNALSTLQVGSGAYGGPWVNPYAPKVNGLYQMWYHAATSGVLPTDIYRATSADLVTWTQVPGPVLAHLGSGFEFDQVADPCVVEAYGTSYIFYSGVNNTTSVGKTGVASVGGTIAQIVAGVPSIAVATPALAGMVRPDGTTITVDGSGRISSASGTGAVTVQVDGATIGTRAILDLKSGSNVTLSGVDNPGSGRVEVTAAATGGGGSSAFSWVAKTANYTIAGTDSGILADASAGAVTITLPTAVGVTQTFAIKKKDGSANAVTVATTGGQTIDNAASWKLTLRGQWLIIGSDGANWYVLDALEVWAPATDSAGTILLDSAKNVVMARVA